ncbi:MAG TPA: GatB/YqeY domain-containing protein [Actinomycetota bacterium]|nr:GatB/YqeY domain-containing protein [Actinomycetota bacterium]
MLKDRLHADLTEAMRARDDVARSALRLTLAAITKAEVAGKEHTTLSDDQVLEVIRSEIKKRTEAAEIYDGAGRAELAERERAEGAVLAPYLPAELSDEELAAVVSEELAKLGAGGRAMGPAIKAVRARVGASASGGRVADAVKAALAAGG